MIFSKNFENDLKSKDTNLIPLVVFQSIPLFISTNSVNVDYYYFLDGFLPTNYKPLLLNIPSIKQSIDIQNKKFKTSSVSLQISNYEYEGKVFSDLLATNSLINQEVNIYWKSPNANKVLDPGFLTSSIEQFDADTMEEWYQDNDDGCPLIYSGQVRRVSHDTKKVTIELEDLTEAKMSKLIPVDLMSTDEAVLERYRNKPIPMVYGSVNRSPVIIDGGVLNYTGLLDSKETVGVSSDTSIYGDLSGLYLYKDDKYLSVPNSLEKEMYYWADYSDINVGDAQWQLSNNLIEFLRPQLIIEGFMQTLTIFKPSVSFRMCYVNTYELANDNNYGLDDEDDTYYEEKLSPEEMVSTIDSDDNTGLIQKTFAILSNPEYLSVDNQFDNGNGIITAKGTLKIEATAGSVSAKEQTLMEMRVNGTHIPNWPQAVHAGTTYINDYNHVNNAGDDDFAFGLGANPNFGDGEYIVSPSRVDDGALYGNELGVQETSNNDYKEWVSFSQDSAEEYYNEEAPFQVNELAFNTGGTWTADELSNNASVPLIVFDREELTVEYKKIHFIHRIWMVNPASSTATWQAGCNFTLNITELNVKTAVDIENPFNEEFFANVKGRVNTNPEHPVWDDGQFLENPAEIIRHILETELSHYEFDEVDYEEARYEHSYLKHGFTIHEEQIGGKDLIEDIAKSTMMYPYFGSDGTFRFNTMKNKYVHSDWLAATAIFENDVVSFSFSKTKPEQVYTRVNLNYNYDYGQKEFMSTLISNTRLDGNPGSDGTELAHYGYESNEDNILDFESKYLGEGLIPANVLGTRLIDFYMNSHLIVKLKLPMKYIGLSVGDKIKFDSLLGGLKAHGIDYVHDYLDLGQNIYPLFFITSVQKNIDSVSVEALQLHHTPSAWGAGLEFANMNPLDEEGFDPPSSLYEDVDLTDLIFTGEGTIYYHVGHPNNPVYSEAWYSLVYEENLEYNAFFPYSTVETGWTNTYYTILRSIQIGEFTNSNVASDGADTLTIGNFDGAKQNMDALFGLDRWYLVSPDGTYSALTSWEALQSPDWDGTLNHIVLAIYFNDGADTNHESGYPKHSIFVEFPGSDNEGSGFGTDLILMQYFDLPLEEQNYQLFGLNTFNDENPDTSPTKITIITPPWLYTSSGGVYSELRWNPPGGIIPEDSGWQLYEDLGAEIMPGCTNPDATNYNPEATVDDGSCVINAPGDINSDGIVNILDVVGMVNMALWPELTEITEDEWIAADLNGDGIINILDILLLVNMIVNPDTTFWHDLWMKTAYENEFQLP